MIIGIDVLVVLFVYIGVQIGWFHGFIGTFLDLIAIVAAVWISSFAYLGPVSLLSRFNITGFAAELVCYFLTLLVISGGTFFFAALTRKRVTERNQVNSIFGALLGILQGLVFAGGMLVLVSSSINGSKSVERGFLSRRVVGFLPALFSRVEKTGVTLPKLVTLPFAYGGEFDYGHPAVRFLRYNFAKLDGATCIKCRGPVEFKGFLLRSGGAMMPLIVCTTCGRKSDGCQTFEGFHALYQACPVDYAVKGQRFDCGNWTNFEWVSPDGECPIDKKVLPSWEYHFPTRYEIRPTPWAEK